ncbi:MAG: glutathione S-transferase family protein [Hoeflea sp.]|uniref:glutathione S-transferase family protein n=1 Tax=Hoeflea sp. TaxID=1940281 RepID=UPI001DA15C6D|nr:glutathione S-transferase family protein [Hoeflea sp.]MBU4531215.1 glutathione S-transferase family protein [Alphaproteobacteria bacterium]MBU4545723.1 glutathione S-transferase family protein [Alphaproteobacteria bacterium]MBU4550692.1 glutathione S-transferase family protein [Alphaproteobacteria bacterium]MBV1724492.1 glutathione S-transferase family protein [Hoeflea sp.]MBV1760512.1 glutathione S-transferase family protein [Hoeflea sp.]
MTDFTLDCFLESGNAYKAALMLELCGADWAPRRVAFFAGQTRSGEFRELNVMGEVPILTHHKADGDIVLSQSGGILDYVSREFDRFGPANEDERREILRWILWDNHKLSSYTATFRFMNLFQKKTDDPVTQFMKARAVNAWKVLEAHMANRDFVATGHPTIADLSLCGYLFWPEQIGMDPHAYPNITAWLDRISALPGYKRPEDLMPSGIDPTTATA